MITLEKGIAPKAMLFANHIDSLAACGILMGDNWLGKRIVTLDLLGDDFLNAVKTGDKVTVQKDGTIGIEAAGAQLDKTGGAINDGVSENFSWTCHSFLYERFVRSCGLGRRFNDGRYGPCSGNGPHSPSG